MAACILLCSAGGVNANIWLQHREHMEKVFHHADFEDTARLLPPTSAAEGGITRPFTEKECLDSLQNAGQYMAAINIRRLDPFYTPTANVPMSTACIESMKGHFFKDPVVASCVFADLHLQVPVLQSSIDEGTVGPKGTRMHVSPTELLIAFMAKVAESCEDAGCSSWREAWKRHMIIAPCLFVKVARLEDLEWKALQLREDNSQKAKLARTAVQRVFEIINRRGQSGKAISAETMEQLYSEKLNMAENSEPVSENWVKTAYDLWDKALHKATVQQVVLAEEEFQPNSIFNTLHKMHAVIVKASTPAETERCFTMMHDQHVADNLKHEDVTVRMLLGKRRDDQGKGYLDLLLYKKKCLQFLLDEIMGPSCLTTEEKTGVRDVLSSCNSYRAHVHEDDAAEGAGDQAAWFAFQVLRLLVKL